MRPVIDLSLYLVLDPLLCGGESGMTDTALKAVRGGACIVQLRAPNWKKRQMAECARALKKVLDPLHVPLIIDDQADVALAVGASGVHVGQKDLQPEDLRRIMGPDAVIGYSVSNMKELLDAIPLAKSGIIDHLGIGPIESTSSKPDAAPPLGIAGFAELAALKPCPAVAIGSVTSKNASALRRAGADGIAVISAICGQTDPEAASRDLLEAFRK